MRGLAVLLLGVFLPTCAGNYRLDSTKASSPRSSGKSVLKLKWHRQLVERGFMNYRPQEWASGVIDEAGTLYIGSSAGRFLAIDTRNGRARWAVETQGGISSRPWYSPRTKMVYFGADDGRMYAVDARSGKVKWQYTTQGRITQPPAYSEGFLLFSTGEGRIYSLDAESGKWRWQYDREIPEGFTIQGHSGVTAHGSIVFCGFADGTLVALRAYSGDVIWTRSLAGEKKQFVDLDATPVLIPGMLLTASYSSGIYALSPDTGSIRWQYPTEGASKVLVHGNRIFFTAPKIGVVALDRNGQLLWRQSIAKGVPTVPVASGRYLFVSGTETGLHTVAVEDGELLQYFDPGQGISATPVLSAGFLAVLSNQGRLYGFQVSAEAPGR